MIFVTFVSDLARPARTGLFFQIATAKRADYFPCGTRRSAPTAEAAVPQPKQRDMYFPQRGSRS
jgi:hypothetical protein